MLEENDVTSMKRLVALMQQTEDSKSNNSKNNNSKPNIIYDKGPDVPPEYINNFNPNILDKKNIDSMKKVLENFQKATERASSELIRESVGNSSLERTLYTEKTDRGIKCLDFEIISENLSSGLKIHHITKKGHKLVENLRAYESALLVLDFIKQGKKLTDDCIQSVIDLDEVYNRNINDAVRFKKRSKLCENSGDFDQSDIWLGRFDSAKRNADLAKLKLKELSIDIL